MNTLRFLVPRLSWRVLGRITGWAALGALVAGGYGILHDQLTYTLAPEYFLRLKFGQFGWVDFGWPDRTRVAGIGLLATWWVGFIGTWLFARVALARDSQLSFPARIIRLWLVMFGAALAGGSAGYWLGPVGYGRLPAWTASLTDMGVADGAAFTQVAGIHWGGYLGALAGWLFALIRYAILRDGPEFRGPSS